METARVWRRGKPIGSTCVMDIEFLFYKMNRGQDIGYTTMRTNIIVLNGTLKIAIMLNFVINILSQLVFKMKHLKPPRYLKTCLKVQKDTLKNFCMHVPSHFLFFTV